MYCVGIDTGKKGGVAVYFEGCLEVFSAIGQDWNSLLYLVAQTVDENPVLIFIEDGFHTQNSIILAQQYRGLGYIEGVLEVLFEEQLAKQKQIIYTFNSSSWYKSLGLEKDKSIKNHKPSINYIAQKYPHYADEVKKELKNVQGRVDSIREENKRLRKEGFYDDVINIERPSSVSKLDGVFDAICILLTGLKWLEKQST